MNGVNYTPKQVLVVGGASLNTIIHLKNPSNPEHLCDLGLRDWYFEPGGTGLGKAANLSLLGFNTTLHAILGKDEAGEKLHKELLELDIKLVIEHSLNKTEQHTNVMLPDGNRISVFISPPDHPEDFKPQSLDTAIAKSDILVPSILPYVKPVLPLMKASSLPIWVDLHDYDGCDVYYQDFIDCAHVLLVSSEKLPQFKHFMQSMIDKGKELVICTFGDRGSLALDSRGDWHECGVVANTPLIDTNGAGDAYFSGFLYAYSQNLEPRICMRYGSCAASACVQSRKLFHPDLSVSHIKSTIENETFHPFRPSIP